MSGEVWFKRSGTEGYALYAPGCGHVLVSGSRARIGDEPTHRPDAPWVFPPSCDACRDAEHGRDFPPEPLAWPCDER